MKENKKNLHFGILILTHFSSVGKVCIIRNAIITLCVRFDRIFQRVQEVMILGINSELERRKQVVSREYFTKSLFINFVGLKQTQLTPVGDLHNEHLIRMREVR